MPNVLLALNQSATTNVEASYDRLRDLAREEARKRNECFDKVRMHLIMKKRYQLFASDLRYSSLQN